uniref:Ampulexin 4 n=1 Tax=Ampulex compressa TaxID=860918 RepID=A0A1W6EVN6_AMPCP|nr:ampulexin 4 [Ampulex compressa]
MKTITVLLYVAICAMMAGISIAHHFPLEGNLIADPREIERQILARQ